MAAKDVALDPASPALPRPGRRQSLERRAFGAASVLLLAHVLDEALVRPPAGAAWQARVCGSVVVVALVALGAATLAVPRGWPRALVLGVLGAHAAAHGATHAVHAVEASLTGPDTTGLLVLVGGVVLLVLAGAALVRPGPPSLGRWRRRGRHLATALVAVAVVVTVLVPVAVGTVQVHLPRRPPAPPPASDFEAVTLHTEDGVELSAWYRRSTNGAAVVLLSSARGDHQAVGRHARMVAAHGYGVLVYDARGSGLSTGTPNGWGWSWLPDVAAAVDHVVAQPDVVAGVGLIGLSTGADVALEAAARDPRVRAVVADGATAQGFADRPPGVLDAVSLWPTYATARALTGGSELPPLVGAVAATAPRPVLLVAAGSIAQEIPLNERYARAGGRGVTLWALPDVAHTGAILARPDEYESRVLSVLDDALLASSGDDTGAAPPRSNPSPTHALDGEVAPGT